MKTLYSYYIYYKNKIIRPFKKSKINLGGRNI